MMTTQQGQPPQHDANLDQVWAVYRQDTGELVETGFETSEAASEWAEDNLPCQRPDAWWYVDAVSLTRRPENS